MVVDYFDYSAPAFKITLAGKPMKPELLNSITSINVEKEISGADKIYFEVQDQMEHGKFMWLDKDVFEMGSEINVQLGYTGKMTHKAVAHISSISTKFSSGLTPTFTIEATHKAFNLLSDKNEMLSYSKKKDSDIVKDIAGKVGLRAKVDVTKIMFEDKNSSGKESYLDFIKRLVSQNSRYEFFISAGKLFFREAATGGKPVVKLKWGQHLENFSPTVNLSKMITTVKVNSSEDKKDINEEAKAGEEKKVDPGKTLGSQKAKKQYGEKMISIPVGHGASQKELKELALAKLEETNADYVTASASTVGIPELKPGVCVQLEGLGKKFSGKYYVTKTKHTIDSSGYKVNFDVRSNVL